MLNLQSRSQPCNVMSVNEIPLICMRAWGLLAKKKIRLQFRSQPATAMTCPPLCSFQYPILSTQQLFLIAPIIISDNCVMQIQTACSKFVSS